MYKVLSTLFILAAVFWRLSIANAEINSVTATIDGLACPFCAYGIEKKLKRVEGVASMDIRMNAGTIALLAGDGLSIDIKQVPQAIRDAGFSLREMRVTATGIVRREGDALLLQYAAGEDFSLENAKAIVGKLTEYSSSGETVEIEGSVEESREGPWTLKPESIAGASD